MTMDLPITALIPADYIQDVELRLATYRAISGIEDERGLREMRTELEDRFGDIPPEVEHLLALIQLRLRSERLGITSIVEREREIVIRPIETGKMNSRKLIGRFGHAIKITPNSIRLRLVELEEEWSTALDAVLDEVELAQSSAAAKPRPRCRWHDTARVLVFFEVGDGHAIAAFAVPAGSLRSTPGCEASWRRTACRKAPVPLP